MKKLLLCMSILAFLSACAENKQITAEDKATATTEQQKASALKKQPDQNASINQDEEIAQARALIKSFAGTLKGELKAGMMAGGPVNALTVCNTKAPQIAEKVVTEKSVNVSRVSLKNRNADNAPNEWQRKVLEDFEARKAAGADPAKLEYSTVVAHQDGQKFRYMKAIPTGGVCLACHGESLSKDVKATITKLYPDDKATDFKLGDIRGSFVVTKVIN